MKKNSVDYTCGRKIPRTKTRSHTKARKLEEEAVLGGSVAKKFELRKWSR
jgi:hypothetical protein